MKPCKCCGTSGMEVRTCPKCNGRTGHDCKRCGNDGEIVETCRYCNGKGQMEDKQTKKGG